MTASARRGFVCGLAAYGLWGLLPLYFRSLRHIDPWEMLAQRILWSALLLGLIVLALGRGAALWGALRNRRHLLTLIATTALIGLNWLTYIYAVWHGEVMQSSLGYFITPLVTVLLGVVFLKERLRPFQIVALSLATCGVLTLVVAGDGIPWIALTLAVSFAFYGLLRKLLPVDGLIALLVETAALAPWAVFYVGARAAEGNSALLSGSSKTAALLVSSGLATTAPLLLFGAAARRLRLSTLGILQYLAPSLQFVLAVKIFEEPFSPAKWGSFGCIWTAIAVYSAASLELRRGEAADRHEITAERS